MFTDKLLTEAARELEKVVGLRADLYSAADRLASDELSEEDVRALLDSLRHRLRPLASCLQLLRTADGRLEHLATVARFRDCGWPGEVRHIRSTMAEDERAGLLRWLDDFFQAASRSRLDALDRLLDDGPLPADMPLLRRRARAAAQGLRLRQRPLASPLLELGMRGLDTPDAQVPSSAVRADLRALLIRLALQDGRTEEAARLFPATDDVLEDATLCALYAQLREREGRERDAEELWATAKSLDPGDLDVVVHRVRRRRDKGDVDGAVTVAREAVDRLRSLVDVEGDLGPLLDTPAEIWLAVAQRAHAERDAAMTDHAATCARAAAGPGDAELLAVVEQFRAEVSEDPEERCQAWTAAADHRSAAGQYRLAANLYATAMRTDGASRRSRAVATASWADVIVVLSSPLPYQSVRNDLRVALEGCLRVAGDLDLTGSESWCFAVLSSIRRQLAEGADEPWREHLAQALFSSARAVALAPQNGGRWEALAEVASALDLPHFALVCSDRRSRSGGDGADLVHAQALANAGRFDEAVWLLSGSSEPWSTCVRGYAQLQAGDADEAVRTLETTTIDPTWDWAWTALLYGLVLTGRRAEAVSRSARWLDQLSERTGEGVALVALVTDAFVRADAVDLVSRAEALMQARGPDTSDGQLGLGRGCILAGRADEGLQVLTRYLQRTESVPDPMAWDSIDRPALEAVACDTGVEVPDLGALDRVAERRLAELMSRDAHTELARLADEYLEVLPAPTVDLCHALAAVARDEPDAYGLIAALSGWEELHAEAESLRTHVSAREAERNRASLAQDAQDAALKGDQVAARAALRQLLAEDAYDTAGLLASLVDDPPEQLITVLRDLAEEGELAEAARAALDWLVPNGAADVSSVDRTYRLRLPASWFEDVADPVSEHDIFLRHLPELRMCTDYSVPAIRVVADRSLEPGGFRILDDREDLVREGQVAPNRRYSLDADWRLLPVAAQRAGRIDDDLGLWSAPAADLAEAGAWSELLTMSAQEAVIAVLGEVLRQRDLTPSTGSPGDDRAGPQTVGDAAASRSSGSQ